MLRPVVTAVYAVSGIHAFLGLLNLVVGVIASIRAEVWRAHSVCPIWSGGFFLISGLLGVLCARRLSSYVIFMFLLIYILTRIFFLDTFISEYQYSIVFFLDAFISESIRKELAFFFYCFATLYPLQTTVTTILFQIMLVCESSVVIEQRGVTQIMCFTAFSVVSMVSSVVSIQLLRLGMVNHTTDGHTFQKAQQDPLIYVGLAVAGVEILVCLVSVLLSCRIAKVAKEEMCKQRDGMFHVKVLGQKDIVVVTRPYADREDLTAV